MALQPKTGWGVEAPSFFSHHLPADDRPRNRDLLKLKPIPRNWLD